MCSALHLCKSTKSYIPIKLEGYSRMLTLPSISHYNSTLLAHCSTCHNFKLASFYAVLQIQASYWGLRKKYEI